MPVIQGANANDYLRRFDALEGMIGDERIIGVGSMCRRAVGGDDGIVSIVDALHRRLPRGIRLHLFGLKSDGAECVADLDGRVARSAEHTSELQSLMRISYAVFCLKEKNTEHNIQ